MLIIGCGNRDRGDDAAGLLATGQLRKLGIEAVDCSGEATALLGMWASAEDVIVIDAVMTGAPLGTLHFWDAQHLPILDKTGSSTHGLGLAEAIELARTLRRLPARLRVFGIEGREFEIGSETSAEVCAGVQQVAEAIVREPEVAATRFPRL